MPPAFRTPARSPAGLSTCPVTGFAITEKAGWTYTNPDTHFRTRLNVIGENILWARTFGAASMVDVEQALALSKQVAHEAFRNQKSYVQISDYRSLRGMGLSYTARKRYVAAMRKRRRLVGWVSICTSPVLRLSIKLAVRLNPIAIPIKIVDSYPAAVRAACELLADTVHDDEKATRSGSKSGADPTDAIPQPAVTAPDRISQPHWHLRLDGYSVTLEAINGKILYSVSKGFFRAAHIPQINEVREQVIQAMSELDGFAYMVADVSQIDGVTRKARKSYVGDLKLLYRRHPFRRYIFCGANGFIRAAAHLARPFLPFKISVAANFDGALKLIAAEERAALKPEAAGYNGETQNGLPGDLPRAYVDQLLGYLGAIDWEVDGLISAPPVDPDHPLRLVFDAVKLIKGELDELMQERDDAEADLRQARNELERRVEERTAALLQANKELNQEVEKRKQALKEIEKSHRELKQTQSQLVQSAKLASIGELAAGVAHELNQPLTVIRAQAQLLKRDIGRERFEPESMLPKTEMIERNTRRMSDIIDHLRTFSRQTDYLPTKVDINRVIKDALVLLNHVISRRDIRIELNLADLPAVRGDANRLEQVVLNLINNALDAMGHSGVLRLTTRQLKQSLGGPQDPLQGDEPDIEVQIDDTGSGIASQHLDKIFDPFFTTKAVGKGTGLGMSISYGIIRDHKGQIEVARTGSEGTSIRFRLHADGHGANQ